MSRTSVLVLLAGAAMSFGAPALAQNANLDRDRAFAQELAADAGTRTSLLQASGGAGHDGKGFMITDGTGNNTLYVGGTIQFRYSANFRDLGDADGSDNNEFTHGFNMGTTRLRASGNIWSKDFGYKLVGNFADGNGNSGGMTLEDAFVSYDYGNGFKIIAGQMKAPLTREALIDNEFQLAIDRSVTHSFFEGGYVQGVAGTYTADAFRVMFSFNDGADSANTPFFSAGEADFALTARVEGKFMGGEWSQFDQYASWKKNQQALLVGGAVHWQSAGETGIGTSDVDILVYTIDASFQGAGFNVDAAFYGNRIDPEGGTSTDNMGGMIQAGFFVTEQTQIYGRWDAIFWDDDFAGDQDDNHFLTIGVAHFLSPESQAARIKFEGAYSFNDNNILFANEVIDPDTGDVVTEAGFVGAGNNGFLGQTDDGEFVIRAEIQGMF